MSGRHFEDQSSCLTSHFRANNDEFPPALDCDRGSSKRTILFVPCENSMQVNCQRKSSSIVCDRIQIADGAKGSSHVRKPDQRPRMNSSEGVPYAINHWHLGRDPVKFAALNHEIN